MLPLSCLLVAVTLFSLSFLSASAQSGNSTTPANISFALLTAAAPFPATFTAGSAYLTTADITVSRNGANDTFPAHSWLLMAGSAQSASVAVYNDVWITSDGRSWQLWNGVGTMNGTAVAGQTNASYWPVAGAASCRDNHGHYFVIAGESIATNSNNTAVPSWASSDEAQHFQPTHYNTTTTPITPRSFATCMATSGGSVVVVGGRSLGGGSGSGLSDVWAFHVDWSEDGVQANDWQLLANATVVEPRYGHASAVAFGQGVDCIDVLYVTGGKNSGNGSSVTTYYNDVYYSTDGGNVWQPRNSTSALWSPRAFHSLTVAPSGLLIVAGGQNDATTFNDVWLSFNGGIDWVLATNAAGFQPRSGHAFLLDAHGSPVVIGGSQYYPSSSAAVYNDVWSLASLNLNNLTATAALLGYNLTATCAALPGIDCTNNCPYQEDFTMKTLIAAVVLGVLFCCIVGFLLWSRRSGPHKQLESVEYEDEYEEEEEEGEEDTAYTEAPH